jgi:lactobin A/cerein 7B family class IIb bacteriocin
METVVLNQARMQFLSSSELMTINGGEWTWNEVATAACLTVAIVGAIAGSGGTVLVFTTAAGVFHSL